MFNKTVLDNGVTVATYQIEDSKLFQISFGVDVGSVNDPQGKEGIAHFLEHMMFNGTETRSDYEIKRLCEIEGTDTNAFTSFVATCYHIGGLNQSLDVSLDVLYDLFENSTHPEDKIEKERNIILQEIESSNNNPAVRAHRNLYRYGFGPSNFSIPIIGYEETVKNITRDDLLDFYEKYKTGNTYVTYAGPEPHSAIVNRIKNLKFKREGKEHKELIPNIQVEKSRVVVDKVENLPAAEVVMAWPVNIEKHAKTRFEESEFLSFIAEILGVGFISPLFDVVREQRGLVYRIRAREVEVDYGKYVFSVSFATRPENVLDVYEAIFDTFDMVSDSGVSDSCFKKARNRLKKDLAALYTDPYDMHRFLLSSILFDKEGVFRTEEDFFKIVDKVDQNVVKEFVNELKNTKPVASIVSKVTPEVEKFCGRFETVENVE